MKKDKKNEKNNEQNRKPKKKRNVPKIILVTILSLGILGIIGGILGFTFIASIAPELDRTKLENAIPSIVYDQNGKEIAKLGNEWRIPVDYDQIPQVLIDAVVATEDSRFFKHNGFDLPRFTKAILDTFRGGEIGAGGGGSTITMQLSKMAFTSTDKSIVRKFVDIYMAIFEIEKNYTKEEILEFYLNRHDFGDTRASGIEAASQFYFGKSVSDINLPEAAMLAGMFQAPGKTKPFNYPENANRRKNEVLRLMKYHGYITEDEYKIACDVDIEDLLVNPTSRQSEYQGYLDTVIEEVKEKTGINPTVTPMSIYTNMDRDFQDYMNKIENGEIVDLPDEVMQMGFVVTETETGKIKAIATGRNREGGLSFNHATQLRRQPGSTFKPIMDYAPGFEFLNWSTYQPFIDEEYTYSDGKPIRNPNRDYAGFITLRNALHESRNIPALKAFQQIKSSDRFEFFSKLGFTQDPTDGTPGKLHEAYSIGGFNGTNPYELAAAYAAFGNGGYYIKPYTVEKIVIQDTLEEIDLTPTKERVMKETTAYLITDVLMSNVTAANGMGKHMNIPGETIAFKSGTTNLTEETLKQYNLPAGTPGDSWGVGYSPNYTVALWIGYPKLSSENHLPTNAYNIRNNIVKEIFKKIAPRNNKQFNRPADIIDVQIENYTYPAKLPSENTPQDLIITEKFIKGTEPTEVSSRFSRLNRPENLKLDLVNNAYVLSWNHSSGMNYEQLEKEYNIPFWGKNWKKYLDQALAATGRVLYDISINGNLVATTDSNRYDLTEAINNYTASNDLSITVLARYENMDWNRSEPNTVTLKIENTPPTITLNGSASIELNVGDPYIELGAIAIDKEDGDITKNIKVIITNAANQPVNKVDTTIPEVYTITYSVKDKRGVIVQVTRVVVVKGKDSGTGGGDDNDNLPNPPIKP